MAFDVVVYTCITPHAAFHVPAATFPGSPAGVNVQLLVVAFALQRLNVYVFKICRFVGKYVTNVNPSIIAFDVHVVTEVEGTLDKNCDPFVI